VTLKEELRSAEVNHAVSIVAANPGVRESMVRRQREWARVRGGGVMEGRDIATVVLPHADLKIYLTASPEERARRRSEEGADALARRDKLDSSRAASPLMLAKGARLVDTTNRGVEEIVEEICAWL
jgi:cytidylate kinase